MNIPGFDRIRLWRIPSWSRVIGLMVLVAVSAYFSLRLSRENDNVAAIWFSDAVLLGILLRSLSYHRPAYLVAGVLTSATMDYLWGDPLSLALIFAACNALEIALAVALLTLRFPNGVDLTYRSSLGYFLGYGIFVTPIVSAVLASAALHFIADTSFWIVLRTWYCSGALGFLLVTPLVLAMRREEIIALLQPPLRLRWLVIVVLMIVVTGATFLQSDYPLLYSLFPVIVLTAFRIGYTGTTITVFLSMLAVIVCTLEGLGRIAGAHASFDQQILFLQLYVATAMVVALAITAALAEQTRLNLQVEYANRTLQSLAITDSLTGLANRRRFDEVLEQEWRRALRDGTTLSLLLIDVDYFKLYNDYYGHRAGDICLQSVAQTLMKHVHRPSDLCARYGGEEFAVILPGADEAGVLHLAEAMRAGVSALQVEHVKSRYGRVTASIGCVSLVPDSVLGIADVIERADRALYDAKSQGRNRVVVAPSRPARAA